MGDEKQEIKMESQGIDWATVIILMLLTGGYGFGSNQEIDRLKQEVAELKGKISVIEHKI